MNWTDPSGNDSGDTVQRQFEIDLLRLLLAPGFAVINQKPCTKAPYSPFGCDDQDQPIQYAIVQGFAQSGYGAATASNCKKWDFKGSKYADNHCGTDMVSYSDAGWRWQQTIDQQKANTLEIQVGNDYHKRYSLNLTDFTYKTKAEGKAIPVSFLDVLSGQIKFEYWGKQTSFPSHVTPVGRNVYAISDGTGASYDPLSYTLHVKVTDNLEIQYTHIQSCNGVNPSGFVGKQVSAGEQLGCYALIGSSTEPHLHVTFKNMMPDSCHPEDAYLNPQNPVGLATGKDYGFGGYAMWDSPPRFGQFPLHTNWGFTNGADWRHPHA